MPLVSQLSDLFNEQDIADLLAAIPELDRHKKSVVRDAIKRLNQSPLKRRVIEAAARDDAPLTPADVDFLWKRIRTARNSAVHGKGARPPTLHEIERAISLVGRLIVYRLSKPPAVSPTTNRVPGDDATPEAALETAPGEARYAGPAQPRRSTEAAPESATSVRVRAALASLGSRHPSTDAPPASRARSGGRVVARPPPC
jgi:hypothetical protein